MRREDDDGRNIFTVAQAIDQGLIPELATTRTRDEVITERISVQNIEFRGVEFLVSPAGCPVLDDFLNSMAPRDISVFAGSRSVDRASVFHRPRQIRERRSRSP